MRSGIATWLAVFLLASAAQGQAPPPAPSQAPPPAPSQAPSPQTQAPPPSAPSGPPLYQPYPPYPPPYGAYPYPYPYPYQQPPPTPPRELPYKEGAAIPPGYHVDTRIRRGPIIAGASMAGSTYMINLLV